MTLARRPTVATTCRVRRSAEQRPTEEASLRQGRDFVERSPALCTNAAKRRSTALFLSLLPQEGVARDRPRRAHHDRETSSTLPSGRRSGQLERKRPAGVPGFCLALHRLSLPRQPHLHTTERAWTCTQGSLRTLRTRGRPTARQRRRLRRLMRRRLPPPMRVGERAAARRGCRVTPPAPRRRVRSTRTPCIERQATARERVAAAVRRGRRRAHRESVWCVYMLVG